MKTTAVKIALKPYLEAVRAHCEGLSKEELVETILDLAGEAPVRERADFLDKIRATAPFSAEGKRKAGTDAGEALIEQLAGLREEIEERIESIENGSYWDEAGYSEESGFDDEPDSVTREQLEELENLFLETGSLFLDGRLETARRLYSALFSFMDEKEEISMSFSGESVDIREERARYCRSVYETADPKRRVNDFFDCMNIDAPMNDYRLDLASEPLPMLQDVMDARSGELADWTSFLPAWEKRLESCHTDRAAVLRMEAVEKLRGADELSVLVREWKSNQPRGYLFWIQSLERAGNWQGMLDVSLEALKALPKGRFREQAAEYLTKAAVELGLSEQALRGKRERFLSLPTEGNLLGLLDEAERQGLRLQELNAVLEHPEEIKRGESLQNDLYIKMLLIAGRLQEAFNEGQGETSLGWSYGKAGVLFAAVLSVLTENSPKTVVVQALLKEYAERSGYYLGEGEKGDTHSEILKGLASVKITESERRDYLAWADKIGRERIDNIVSGKHRRAYDRAARTLGALAEYYTLSNERKKAQSLLEEFFFHKFPRHRAFRDEVKRVVSSSALLKDLRVI
jgi:hypothetical protein